MTHMCVPLPQGGDRASVTIPYDLWHSRWFALTSGMRDYFPPMDPTAKPA
jgi:hypothetical protein